MSIERRMQHLLNKLPQVRDWILKTLDEHRSQARPVASYGFSRLPQFYSADTLAKSVVVEVPRVPMPPLAGLGLPGLEDFEAGPFAGITYLDTYFVCKSQAGEEALHFHELVPIVQWQNLGPVRFLAAYATGYLLARRQNKDPYRDNRLEIMAYDLQAHFASNGLPANVEPLIRQQCEQKILPMLERAMKGETIE